VICLLIASGLLTLSEGSSTEASVAQISGAAENPIEPFKSKESYSRKHKGRSHKTMAPLDPYLLDAITRIYNDHDGRLSGTKFLESGPTAMKASLVQDNEGSKADQKEEGTSLVHIIAKGMPDELIMDFSFIKGDDAAKKGSEFVPQFEKIPLNAAYKDSEKLAGPKDHPFAFWLWGYKKGGYGGFLDYDKEEKLVRIKELKFCDGCPNEVKYNKVGQGTDRPKCDLRPSPAELVDASNFCYSLECSAGKHGFGCFFFQTKDIKNYVAYEVDIGSEIKATEKAEKAEKTEKAEKVEKADKEAKPEPGKEKKDNGEQNKHEDRNKKPIRRASRSDSRPRAKRNKRRQPSSSSRSRERRSDSRQPRRRVSSRSRSHRRR